MAKKKCGYCGERKATENYIINIKGKIKYFCNMYCMNCYFGKGYDGVDFPKEEHC